MDRVEYRFFSTSARICVHPRPVLRAGYRALVALACLILVGCAAPVTAPAPGRGPTPAPATPWPQPADDAEAFRQLILLEGQGVVRQDIAGLTNLWALDAVITDAKHTPDQPGDDARWRGRDAIRERYMLLVFPGNPAVNSPSDIEITIDGDQATAVSTTRIGQEVSPGGDRWSFARRAGRWWITGLTYNLEPQ
jgi:hypothetical protein